MARAARICPRPGCWRDRPCPEHQSKTWQERTPRRNRTASGWEQQRQAERILRRDHRICHVCGKPDADQVDHVIPLAEGGADTPSNKAPIHREPCHREKTQAEAARGRRTTP